MKTYKKGISLIVLVITVLVLAILATTVIISLSNTNIITEANEAVVKTRFKSMQEQLTLYVADQYAVADGKFKLEDLDAEAKSATIDTIFPELKDSKYYDYVSLVDGKIVLAEDTPDREIAVQVIGETADDEEVEIAEVITNYTQADIDASNGKLVAIGATDSLYVVAAFSDDGSTVTITKNGASSDGIIAEYAFDENIGSTTSPIGNPSYTTAVIKKGVVNISGFLFHSFNGEQLTTITIPNSVTSIGVAAFECALYLESIIFEGTMAEWNAITFSDYWNSDTGDYIIHCTDGDIAKS